MTFSIIEFEFDVMIDRYLISKQYLRKYMIILEYDVKLYEHDIEFKCDLHNLVTLYESLAYLQEHIECSDNKCEFVKITEELFEIQRYFEMNHKCRFIVQ